ncbi:proline-, glutamic acid- and leucine-rich protein 1-like [Pogonomyrmex barbatus]|uniref:Proline-, glutamic acid- and Leucine-rich protein 1-like n=1 Tax=Pogonomyrmex barbatus TaxID=144034 RepID=A0A6I9WFR1_9HYME|nr:proline-, glutamic acid- and leucine-rich protein 1-like [Pogonomyrmex barbatus]XP_011639873.1 proline-, glutamic acid- and leucine-rich protein 1-like [Pogonomyrmex barbatus]
MASITKLVNSVDVNSKKFESIVHDLVNNDDVPFDNQEVDNIQNAIIKKVNLRINQGGCNFLFILDRLLPTCSKDTFLKHGLFWISSAMEVLENVHSSMQNLTLACKVLGVLVERCKQIPELHKQISMQYVKQLVNILSSLRPDAKYGAIYYLMAVLLYHYPEVCERFQKQIRKMILLQIDSMQENMVNASARCYLLLSKVTERSFKLPPSKSMYTVLTYSEVLLCNNLHTIMDELFSELVELESVDIWGKLELPDISNKDIVQYYNGQRQRFSNLCTYLSIMLRGYEERNSVLPHDILGLLCRGLAITPLNLKDKVSCKEQMLYIILPKMHISLLTVLDAFINGFAQELIPYGTTILYLFQHTLEWTSTILENQITFSNSKPFRNVRIHTYKCLCSWLMNVGSLSGIEKITNECVISILKDVTPERDCILLSMQQKTQNLSKRTIKRSKRSQCENNPVLNNGESSIKSGCLDADLCREALIVLQNILSSGSILLKQMFYQTVQNVIISLLYNLYLSSTEQNFYKAHTVCRLELFKVLKALQMYPHVTLAFPIQYCLEISQMAALDIDLSIAQEAKFALAELEKIIHPAAPTLRLSRRQESDNEFENEMEKVTNIDKLDKRSRTSLKKVFFEEKECSDSEDAIQSVSKRPKITAIEIIQNETDIQPLEKNDSIDINKSKIDDNLYKEIEEEETKNVLQNKIQHKNQSQLNIDAVANVTIESRMECELVTEEQLLEEQLLEKQLLEKQFLLEKQLLEKQLLEKQLLEEQLLEEQHTEEQNHEQSDIITYTSENKTVNKSPEIDGKEQKFSQDSSEKWENIGPKIINSLNLLQKNEIK